MSVVNYKANELNLFHSEGYQFKIREVKSGNPEMPPCFSLDTSNSEGAGSYGVYFPQAYVPTMYGVRSVGAQLGTHEYKLGSLENAINNEASARQAGDEKSASDLSSAVAVLNQMDNGLFATLSIIDSQYKDADFKLNNSLDLESKRAQASELVLSNNLSQANININAEVKRAGDAEAKIIADLSKEISDRKVADESESKARAEADSKHSSDIASCVASVSAESKRASEAEAGLQNQISNILSNTDAVALNSLAELVADYRNNGSSLQARVVYLEGCVASLLNK